MLCTVLLALAMSAQAPAADHSHARVDTQIFDLLWKGYTDSSLSTTERKKLERLSKLHPECYESLRSKVDAMASPRGIAIWREQIRLHKAAVKQTKR